MLSLRNSLYVALLVFPIFLSHALPIMENVRIQPVSLRETANSSLLKSGASVPVPPILVSVGRPSLHSSDGENPSLLTSIPTFAPPEAIKKRDDEQAINIPNPSIAFGIPSLPAIRAYISGRLRKKQRRGPKADSGNRLSPATADAIQPHKAPVPDSTIDWIQGAGRKQNTESANDNIDAIQDMASTGSATPPSIAYNGGVPSSPESVDPHSLSGSLGIISHPQWVEEDQGKKRRTLVGSKAAEQHRKRGPELGDNGDLGEELEDDEVPTIWNGEVKVDDLDEEEARDFDNMVALFDFIRSHRGRNRPSNSSATAASPAQLNASSSATLPTSTISYNSSGSRVSTTSDKSSPTPKSLAKGLGLISHSSFQNRTRRGHRKDNNLHRAVKVGSPRALDQPSSVELLPTPLKQEETQKAKRQDDYDPNLEPIDISDEAYEAFRTKYPAFFGDRRRMKRRHAKTVSEKGSEKRDAMSPSWLVMLLSPSALLEKRPVSKVDGSEKRDSTQTMSVDQTLWVPDAVPFSPDEPPPSNPKRRHERSLGTSGPPSGERRDNMFRYKDTNMEEDERRDKPHRREGSVKGHQDSPEHEEGSQRPPSEMEARDSMYHYFASAASEESDSDDDDDSFPNKSLFDSFFEQAWKDEHPKRAALAFNNVALGGRDDNFPYADSEEDYDVKSLIALWNLYAGHNTEQARKNGEHGFSAEPTAINPARMRRDGAGQSS